MTLIINIGKWGGIYKTDNRICLGFIAFTLFKFDIDPVLGDLTDCWEQHHKQESE